MAKTPKIKSSDDAWEKGKLGRDEQFVKVSKSVDEAAIDTALDLKLVSIRLQKSLIDDFKAIAKINNGIGYQTLMRQILTRFVEAEKKKVLGDYFAEQREKEKAAQEAEAQEEERKRA